MKEITLRLEGVSSLLMHSSRLSDPLDPMTRKLASLTAVRKKTEDTHRAVARAEFIGGLYHNDEIGVYLPGENILASALQAARLSKQGTKVERGVMLASNSFFCPLEFDGPSDPDALFDDGRFVDRRSVKVGQNRVMRTRPIFRDWATAVGFVVDEAQIEVSDFVAIVEKAGLYIGVGDHRKSGGHGRYDVEVVG